MAALVRASQSSGEGEGRNVTVHRWLSIAGAALALVVPAHAQAGESPLDRIAPIVRYVVPSTDGAADAGAARTIASAPIADVRAVALDYEKGQLIPGIDRTKVVARRGNVADLYIRAPVLHGAVMLWAVLRLTHTVHADHECIEGTMIRGNL